MDLRTYPTQRIYETPPFHCSICVEPSEPSDGYIDIGPADILCVPCARRAAAMLETVTVTAAPALNVSADYFQPTTAEQLVEVLGRLASTVYPCQDCGRTFARPANLGAHRRTHRVAV